MIWWFGVDSFNSSTITLQQPVFQFERCKNHSPRDGAKIVEILDLLGGPGEREVLFFILHNVEFELVLIRRTQHNCDLIQRKWVASVTEWVGGIPSSIAMQLHHV